MMKNRDTVAKKARDITVCVIKYLLIFAICYVIIYPIAVKLAVSFMSKSDLSDLTVKWLGRHPTLDNFKTAWRLMKYSSSLLNSVFVSFGVTILQVFVCTLAAYGYARTSFKFKNILFALTIFSLIVPPQTYMLSTYVQFRTFDPFGIVTGISGDGGVLNTFIPFFVLAVTGSGIKCGLHIYIMRQFFRNMPIDTEEAAFVDGASTIRTFWSVMLPNAVPSIATISVLSFVWQYNDNFFSTLLAPKLNFVTTALNNLSAEFSYTSGTTINVNPILQSATVNSGAILMLFPVIILFIISQRYFIQGIERSGIVG